MQFLRCVHAEFLLVLPRIVRTHLGFALLSLGISLVWLHAHGLDALTVVLQAGALGAIVGAAGVVGHESDRPALKISLTHPTTPLAIALGRWLAIVSPAVALALGCTAVIEATPSVLMASLLAAAAVGSCALAIVLTLGKGAATTLFLLMAVAGTVAPERLVDLARPGLLRLTAASVLELGPALWHYRDIVTGDVGAVLHALAWTGLGLLLAAAFIGRRRR
jgi:hypothetical protein